MNMTQLPSIEDMTEDEAKKYLVDNNSEIKVKKSKITGKIVAERIGR